MSCQTTLAQGMPGAYYFVPQVDGGSIHKVTVKLDAAQLCKAHGGNIPVYGKTDPCYSEILAYLVKNGWSKQGDDVDYVTFATPIQVKLDPPRPVICKRMYMYHLVWVCAHWWTNQSRFKLPLSGCLGIRGCSGEVIVPNLERGIAHCTMDATTEQHRHERGSHELL